MVHASFWAAYVCCGNYTKNWINHFWISCYKYIHFLCIYIFLLKFPLFQMHLNSFGTIHSMCVIVYQQWCKILQKFLFQSMQVLGRVAYFYQWYQPILSTCQSKYATCLLLIPFQLGLSYVFVANISSLIEDYKSGQVISKCLHWGILN